MTAVHELTCRDPGARPPDGSTVKTLTHSKRPASVTALGEVASRAGCDTDAASWPAGAGLTLQGLAAETGGRYLEVVSAPRSGAAGA